MTLPASGQITLGQVAAELGLSLPLSLGGSRVLALAGKSALPVSPSDLYGKSAATQAPLSATAQGQNLQYSSVTAAGTATSSATAYPAGGAGSYSYAWSVVSNTGAATVGALNQANVTISKAFSQQTDGQVTVALNLTVTDSKGASVTVSNIQVIAGWYSNR